MTDLSSIPIREASARSGLPAYQIHELIEQGLLFSMFGRISLTCLPALKRRAEACRQRARELAQQADAASREARP